ncbi:tafazzin isoform X2 [Macrobrachium rosenbergii]|uniref:tafazzin isoform X2 n=1 Tax=Macrobrachium rosenbergii TaxID=79674 RepID=UPI0034D59E5A
MEYIPLKQEDIPLRSNETGGSTSVLSSSEIEDSMQEVKIHPKEATDGGEKQFSLRHGWPFPDMTNPPLSFRIRSAIIIPMVGTFSKVLMSILRLRELWNAKKLRWSPAAHDIAFTKRFHSWFFSAGRCVPIIRGIGVYQRAMDFLLDRLKEGEWVHIFPEGKVNMTQEHMRFKWGVGRLIYESPVCPIVLPFYHVGMDAVLPNKAPYIPRVGKKVTVLIGEPMDFKEIVAEMKAKQEDPTTARKIITDKIQEEIWRLRERAEELHEKMLQGRCC